MMDGVVELVERIENARFGSCFLDEEIALLIGWRAELHPDPQRHDHVWIDLSGERADLPSFTRSLDAALSLIPADWKMDMKRDHGAYACVWGPHGNRSRRAKTLPLALSAAALLARENSAMPSAAGKSDVATA